VTQGPVVLWVEEGARWRIAQRIRRLRRGLGITDQEAAELPIRFIVLRGLKVDRPSDLIALRKDVELGPMPVLLVVDNLTRIHTKDENKPSEISPVLDALAGIQRDYGTTIDIIHHDRKNGAGDVDASTQLRGSSDLDAWWRNLIYVGRRDDGSTTVKPQSKDGVAALPYLVHVEDLPDGSVCMVWDGVADDPRHGPVDGDVLAAIGRLGLRATMNTVVKEAGRGKSTVIGSLTRLEKAGKIAREDCVIETGQKAFRYRLETGREGA
jgi:hypothetical protein